MNREIKFRAWSKEVKGWIQGFNMVNFHGYYNKGLEPEVYRYDKTWKLSEIELCQYIGLKDKKRYEIYEGHIVRFKDEYQAIYIGVIMWQPQGACFYITYVVEEKSFYAEIRDQAMYGDEEGVVLTNTEIIGHIFENPELITPTP